MSSHDTINRIRESVNQVFAGKEEVVENLLVCLLSGGHVLLEDVPGVGKTTVALALAKSMKCSFGRIQCTPDTLPGDITGVSVYNMKTGEFSFQPGAVMNQVLLADEINRTSPKTQASLLEAMSEGQVTVDGVVHKLPEPFFVIATQNPVEFLGTYPLPEAQLDRFMMRLSIDYPSKEEEMRMVELALQGKTTAHMDAVCQAEDILSIRKEVEAVLVKENVLSYMTELVTATRTEEHFVLGASPRALLALVRASQARAFLQERDFVKPDDVKAVAKQVLLHRLVLTSEARMQKADAEKILLGILNKVKVPV